MCGAAGKLPRPFRHEKNVFCTVANRMKFKMLVLTIIYVGFVGRNVRAITNS